MGRYPSDGDVFEVNSHHAVCLTILLVVEYSDTPSKT